MATIDIPEHLISDASALLGGSYSREGFDLIITTADGEQIIVFDYFSFQPPPNLMLSDGIGITPDVVTALLHLGPTEVMFAGPASSSVIEDIIGKVKFIAGSAYSISGTDGSKKLLTTGDVILKLDELIVDGPGYLSIEFADGTRFSQGRDSRIILNEFDFDRVAQTGAFEATVLKGGFNYKSGLIGDFAGVAYDHSKITTPSAVIRIRGSELEGFVNPNTGETTIIHRSGILTIEDINGLNQIVLDEPGSSVVITLTGNPQFLPIATPELEERVKLTQSDQLNDIDALADYYLRRPAQTYSPQVNPPPSPQVEPIQTNFESPRAAPTIEPAEFLPDNPPQANNDVATLIEGATFDLSEFVLSNDIDPDANQFPQIQSVDTTQTLGQLTFDQATQSLVYNANTTAVNNLLASGQPVADSFTYTVGSGDFVSTATVSITINLPAAPPPIVILGQPPGIPNVTADAGDVILDVLSLIPGGDINHVITELDGTLTIGTVRIGSVIYSPNGEFLYLNAGETFLDQFGFTVENNLNQSADGTFLVRIIGQADAPTVSGAITVTITEDSAALQLNLLDNVQDPDQNETLTVTNLSVLGDQSGVSISGQLLTLTTLAYQSLAEGQDSQISINYTVQDSTNLTVNHSSIITITGVNDAPTTVGQTILAVEDTTYIFALADFAFQDVDTNDSLQSLNLTNLAGNLLLRGNLITGSQVITRSELLLGELTYQPGTNLFGDNLSNFTFTVSDGQLDSNSGAITISVLAVNDVPSTTDNAISLNEDTPYQFSLNDFAFSDPDADDALSQVTLVTLPSLGVINLANTTVTANQSISRADIENGSLVYIPPLNVNGDGLDSLMFTVSDGNLTSNIGQLNFDVTPVSDAPTTSDADIANNSRTPFRFSLANFAFDDPDTGDALVSIMINTVPFDGQIRLDNNTVTIGQVITAADIQAGALEFIFGDGLSGQSFMFQVSDGLLLSNNARITFVDPGNTIIDTQGNDAPTTSDFSVENFSLANFQFSLANFAFNDPDLGDTLDSIVINTVPIDGNIRLDNQVVTVGQVISAADIGAGLLEFDFVEIPSPLSFMFQVSDGSLLSNSAQFSFINSGDTGPIFPITDGPIMFGGPSQLFGISELIDLSRLGLFRGASLDPTTFNSEPIFEGQIGQQDIMIGDLLSGTTSLQPFVGNLSEGSFGKGEVGNLSEAAIGFDQTQYQFQLIDNLFVNEV